LYILADRPADKFKRTGQPLESQKGITLAEVKRLVDHEFYFVRRLADRVGHWVNRQISSVP